MDLPADSQAVIGSPQSGKTTLIRHWVSLLEEELAPDQILVLTPTRSAASTLRDSIALDSRRASTSPRARSITSFAYQQLAPTGVGLLSGAGQERLIRELVMEQKPNWSGWGFDAGSIQLTGFVQELRDLFAVLMENSLGEKEIQQLMQNFPGLRLQAAIDLLPSYQNWLGERQLVDPTQLSLLAIENLGELPQAVLVDDAQNLSAGQLRLVVSLLGSKRSFLFGDPDAAVLGFRNSSPAAFLELSRARGFGEIKLAPPTQLPPQLANMMAKLVQRIPTSLVTEHRPKPLGATQGDFHLFESKNQESDHLASWLRRIRVSEQIPWDEMVVVARTRNQLEQLSKDLAARFVPNRIAGVQLALRDQPMARALLDFVAIALGEFEDQQLEDLLLSPLVGLTAIELRALHRRVRLETGKLARIGLRELFIETPEWKPQPIAKLLDQIAKLRKLESPGAHQAVSLGFELADRRLEELARGSSAVSLAANRALDSALELFAAAQRWDSQSEGALEFVRQQLEIGVPEDSLAPIGKRSSVLLATPAQLGQSYRVVALPRLQEGIWPNLNPRNSLLRAGSLQAYLLGRLESPLQPAQSELADELRFFYRSIGASSEKLWLSAMSDQSEQPSQFLTMLGLNPEPQSGQHLFDLRRLVGTLRRELVRGDREAASKLAALALADVPGAHPRYWQGLMEQAAGDFEVPSLSASRLSDFEKCPLHWFVNNFGGNSAGFSASLGTLLHSALEHSADGLGATQFLSENWHTLEFESKWQEGRALRQAAQMATLLDEYLEGAAASAANEQSFVIELGGLQIRGKIDRVEITDAGPQVVDLKTGSTVPKPEGVASNKQLAIYQLAVRELYGETAGARLVSIGSGSLKEVSQLPVDDASVTQLEDLLADLAGQLQSGYFSANVDEHCAGERSCQLLITKAVTFG